MLGDWHSRRRTALNPSQKVCSSCYSKAVTELEHALTTALNTHDWNRAIAVSDQLIGVSGDRGHLGFHTARVRALFGVGRRWEAWVYSALARAFAERGRIAEFAVVDDEIRSELPEGPLPEAIIESFIHVPSTPATARALATTLLGFERGLERELRMLRCIFTEFGEAPDPADVEFLVRDSPTSLFALNHRFEQAKSAEDKLAFVDAILATEKTGVVAPIDQLQHRFGIGVHPAMFDKRRVDLLVALGREEEAQAQRKVNTLNLLTQQIASERKRLVDVCDEIEAVFGAALALVQRDATLAHWQQLVDHVLAVHARTPFEPEMATALHGTIAVGSGGFGEAAWPLHDHLAANLGIG